MQFERRTEASAKARLLRPDFDQNFDHDYLFKLPLAGSGMPHHVDDALLHAMSGTELSRVRTEL